jgi:23S rRNA (cytidine2498-2'-O)-methyltransferase
LKAIFIHVRQGFESDAAEEIKDHLKLAEISATSIDTAAETAFIRVKLSDEDWQVARQKIKLEKLIFARQLLWQAAQINLPPDGDRASSIIQAIQEHLLPSSGSNAFSALQLETPDTDSSKELSHFCKALTRPIENTLNKLKLLPKGKGAAHLPRINIVMLTGQQVSISLSDVGNSSPWTMGIPRLRFPPNAPSRSTLKLEEAFHVFLGATGMAQELRPQMLAVDLGACPGGWTYQFVQRGIQTIAVDNGAIDEKLMASGLVTHLREDAFKFRPHERVDWLVCDVVEQPSKISALIADWFTHDYCKRAIFNLKLPMKQRYRETKDCLRYLETTVNASGRQLNIAAKQLYHDRKEVTVFCSF